MTATPRYSPSVERALTLPRPRWRGAVHKWAFFVSVPVGLAMVAVAPDGRSALAGALFAAGMWAMFGVSALVHLKQWSPGQFHTLFRLDHSAIFFCIAAHASAVLLLALDGRPLQLALGGFWLGAGIGIGAEWLPFHPPRGLMNTMFLVLGWGAVLLLPWLWDSIGVARFALLAFGGVLYTVGAVIVGAQRPDPNPEVFGYHEVWHVFVVLAVICHLLLVLSLY
ncbi:MAG: hemolysin III family protein [Acidimicrobiia bacterium]|nr:hemolysin III family protein [Acidimicrobiia bacterium]